MEAQLLSFSTKCMKDISTMKILVWVVMSLVLTACTEKGGEDIGLVDGQVVWKKGERTYEFAPEFTVIYTEKDPRIAMRPAGIDKVPYNIATWETYKGKVADLKVTDRAESMAGDGFDDSILEGKADKRSPNPLNAGAVFEMTASDVEQVENRIVFRFADQELFSLTAQITLSKDKYPQLSYSIEAKTEGFFSVGYTGAAAYDLADVEEIWQPLIWQEKRFPEGPYMTLAYRTPVPTTLVYDGQNTIGVMAASEEFPFDPLPVMKNSRFGVMVRNERGQAQAQLFAPVIGGIESKLSAGDTFDFKSYLVVEPQNITGTYESLARNYFGFRDFRHNEIATLNETFENIVDYSLSDHAWFLDSLKGCAYSTDVPGAVKNVSSLNPLELAIATDNQQMFEERAYPIMEFMLSREKFLFSLDPEQKIQHPSRKLAGPIAPVSELVSLYNVLGDDNDYLIDLAEKEFSKSRIRNLDVKESGDNWINAMHLYKATKDSAYLKKATSGADAYIKSRIDKQQTGFDDPYSGGFFFWTGFAPRWMELTELYEITQEEKYLEAARKGARYFTMFTWMSPQVPDSSILVNEGGEAPMYWYLRSKGHNQMYYPEEEVEAWRLSEIGLTPESSGTSTGHRAIFMANFAPWMLRLGYYANDQFLQDVARSAIIGRYRNFPGYHINTARTTAYEKEDYPLHEHKDLSVNSFHYNHILPMASMLLDYLVTDAFVKSEGQINFPSEFIEGYAYLRNKMYGSEKGAFYGISGVQLWMPKGLLSTDNVELNYISGYVENKLCLAFMNQSSSDQKAHVVLNPSLLDLGEGATISYLSAHGKEEAIDQLEFDVQVGANGLVALAIEGVEPKVQFQQSILSEAENQTINDYKEVEFGAAKAMLIHMGEYAQRAYIYLQKDDSELSEVTLTYRDGNGKEESVTDQYYPYEFTIPVNDYDFQFRLQGRFVDGRSDASEWVTLGGSANEAN